MINDFLKDLRSKRSTAIQAIIKADDKIRDALIFEEAKRRTINNPGTIISYSGMLKYYTKMIKQEINKETSK